MHLLWQLDIGQLECFFLFDKATEFYMNSKRYGRSSL